MVRMGADGADGADGMKKNGSEKNKKDVVRKEGRTRMTLMKKQERGR